MARIALPHGGEATVIDCLEALRLQVFIDDGTR
jgi:hypothetical protein